MLDTFEYLFYFFRAMCGPQTVCWNPALGTNINGILVYVKLYSTSIQIVDVHIYSFWIKPIVILKSLIRSWLLSAVAYFYCVVSLQQDKGHKDAFGAMCNTVVILETCFTELHVELLLITLLFFFF